MQPDQFDALIGAEVSRILFVDRVVPMLVRAQAQKPHHIVSVIGVVEGSRRGRIGQGGFVQVVFGAAGHVVPGRGRTTIPNNVGPFGVDEIVRDRVDGDRVLRGENAGRPVVKEGPTLPPIRVSFPIVSAVEPVDQVEDGLAP